MDTAEGGGVGHAERGAPAHTHRRLEADSQRELQADAGRLGAPAAEGVLGGAGGARRRDPLELGHSHQHNAVKQLFSDLNFFFNFF